MKKITTHSDQETKDFGKKFASSLRSGDVVCLYGELGAGKTTLVKGIAEGLGIKDDITSPTFTLMNVYQIEPTPPRRPPARGESPTNYKLQTLVHIDTYRLKNERELLDIGVEDYLGQPGTVTIVEWPEKVEGLLKNKKVIKITLEHGEKDERTINLSS
ncbi:MAG: tRNA (adenosine(37)-N6)-threonylcarbamoyltransferase complex ATPase subunit type 1 TsaE [Candidatus Magasanikbacteria bacterium]|nr:tRNA (adenosine(37)-N6)-threonylcarbamoyltransferase complex ATPase subunit type 1 TsaE [Candidatus Magasanikbacteria bacterium]